MILDFSKKKKNLNKNAFNSKIKTINDFENVSFEPPKT